MENYKGMIVVHGDLFALDPAREYLIDQQDTQRQQSISTLGGKDNHLDAWYNPRTRMFYPFGSITPQYAAAKHLEALRIPLHVIRNSGRMPEHKIERYNKESLAGEFGYISISQAIADRLNGTLLTTEIDHIRYTIDPERLEIRQTERPEIKFSFSHRALFNPSEQYYHAGRKEPVALPARSTEFPAGVVLLQFPSMAHLDLVGYTLACKSPVTTLLSYYPMQDEGHKIHMINLAQTHYPELVRRNQIELETQGRPAFAKRRMVTDQTSNARKKKSQHP
jgi:hypothetical protein